MITDAHVTANVGSTNFGDCASATSCDAFTLTFNEQMNSNTTGIQIQVTDSDPNTSKDLGTIVCALAGTAGPGQALATCSWNAAFTVLTVTINTNFNTTGTTNGNGLQLPLTITATTGLSDFDDSVAPNLGASDKTIE